jgi:hypothetical protein
MISSTQARMISSLISMLTWVWRSCWGALARLSRFFSNSSRRCWTGADSGKAK